ETEPGHWVEVPTSLHQPDGLISTETTHFSNWVAGWRPTAWSLDWTPPAVSEFTGAATYSYPIDVPPGRNGLQPSLALSYSSSALNGAIRRVSMGTIATGWSLSDINITRSKIETEAGEVPEYRNQFRLNINGTGYRLVQGETNGGRITFYVEDAPQIRVYNYGGLKWNGNVNHHNYWIVRT